MDPARKKPETPLEHELLIVVEKLYNALQSEMNDESPASADAALTAAIPFLKD